MRFDDLYNIAGKKIVIEMNQYLKGCKCCSEMFTSKQSKYRHENNCKHNPGVYKLQFNECGKKASRKDSLNSHKLKCKGAKKLIYIWGKRYKQRIHTTISSQATSRDTHKILF